VQVTTRETLMARTRSPERRQGPSTVVSRAAEPIKHKSADPVLKSAKVDLPQSKVSMFD
jgi:hypothetical protein